MTISGFVEYVKQIWKNKPDRTTPITAAALTHIEDGIKGNSDAINKIAQAVVDNIVNDPQKIASMAALYAVNESVKKNATAIETVNNNLSNYATKSELTASKNGYPGVKTIKSLSSASQLTQAGSYHFEAITVDVNKDAGTEIFSEYNVGDFYALLLGEDINSNDGCNFGTLLIASPRINNGIWICTIWQKKMIHWYKITRTS